MSVSALHAVGSRVRALQGEGGDDDHRPPSEDVRREERA
jgi:hypothetical protein